MMWNFVTTFAEKHWYGFKLIESADQFLPESCKITAVLDEPREDHGRVTYVKFPEAKQREFANSFAIHRTSKIPAGLTVDSNPQLYDKSRYFLWDASRFSHKIFAINEALKTNTERYVVWCDSDVVWNKPVPDSFLQSMVEEGCYISYLSRAPKRHTECGFVIYDTHHEYHETFWKKMISYYDSLSLLKLKKGWTDCHVFDALIEESETKNVKHKKLCVASDVAWQDSGLIEYSDHFKNPINKAKIK